MDRSPEEQLRIDNEIRATETSFAQTFGAMDTSQFIDQGVSIFRSAADGLPSVNESADRAVEAVLRAVVKAEAPQPFMGGRTAAAWRMYTAELVRRAAANQAVEFREIPLEDVPVPEYKCDGWTTSIASREIPKDISLAEDLLANFRIAGVDYIHAVSKEIEQVWFNHLATKQPSVNSATHRVVATSVGAKYEKCFLEMVKREDASILRRGLTDHDFSHVVEFVTQCSFEVNQTWVAKT